MRHARSLLLVLAWLGGPRGSCPADPKCLQWAFDYFGDCVCTLREGVSLALGLASVLCWGVAEIPQIVANCVAGSTEGVSLTFLLTWTVGDIFNLTGCLLEPATLPTQLYMAVMYTITTVVLVVQSMYYEFLVPKQRKAVHEVATDAEGQGFTEPLLLAAPPQVLPAVAAAPLGHPAGVPVSMSLGPSAQAAASEAISMPLSRKSSTRSIHISSARSLASSHTPSLGSFIPGSLHGHPHLQQQQQHVGSLLSQSPGQGHPHISLRSTSAGQGAHPVPLGSSLGQAPSTSMPRGGVVPQRATGFNPGQAAAGPSGSASGSGSTPARAVLSLGLFLSLGMFFSISPHNSITPWGSTSSGSTSSIGNLLSPVNWRHAWSSPSSVAAHLRKLLRRGHPSREQGGGGAVFWEDPQQAQGGSGAPGRRLLLLQDGARQPLAQVLRLSSVEVGDEASGVGEILGWLMAAIYMGGRIPQIYLNIQRGSVEGLSPLMFLFALLGNVTYVGSILVRSVAWDDIKPNLPWIVDAAVCVLLDIFILAQFVYYTLTESKEPDPLDFLEGPGQAK